MMFEGEVEDGAESGLEKESKKAEGARRVRGVANPSILRFIFMPTPKLFAEIFPNREAKLRAGQPPANDRPRPAPLIPHAQEKNKLSHVTCCTEARVLPFPHRMGTVR